MVSLMLLTMMRSRGAAAIRFLLRLLAAGDRQRQDPRVDGELGHTQARNYDSGLCDVRTRRVLDCLMITLRHLPCMASVQLSRRRNTSEKKLSFSTYGIAGAIIARLCRLRKVVPTPLSRHRQGETVTRRDVRRADSYDQRQNKTVCFIIAPDSSATSLLI
jgi:hypothetical protein